MRNILIALFLTIACSNQAQTAEFYVLPGTKSLLVMGTTMASDVVTLEDYINSAKKIDTLILKGPGGDLEAGYKLAELVLNNDLSIIIPENTDCASACSIIFVAGKYRKMEPGSRLGFHLPSLNITNSQAIYGFCKAIDVDLNVISTTETMLGSSGFLIPFDLRPCIQATYQLGMKDIRRLDRFIDRDGISDKVIDLIISTPPSEMVWVDVLSAKKYGLIYENK